MPRVLHLLILTVILNFCLSAEQLGRIPPRVESKSRVSDDLLLTWLVNQTSVSDSVELFDFGGRPLANMQLLPLVPEANRVSVRDADFINGKEIAVAAAYAKPGAVQSMLLIFDFSGKLQKAIALAPSREISRMTIDGNGNIWTLTAGVADQKPSTAPMLVEYDSSGNEVRNLLPRDLFPVHANNMKFTPLHGWPNMGYADGKVWFWLPESTDMVTVNTETAEVTRTLTGEPTLPAGFVPLTLHQISPSLFAMRMVIHGKVDPAEKRPIFLWSPASKAWTSVDHPSQCEAQRTMLGAFGGQLVFSNSATGDLCTWSLPAQATSTR